MYQGVMMNELTLFHKMGHSVTWLLVGIILGTFFGFYVHAAVVLR